MITLSDDKTKLIIQNDNFTLYNYKEGNSLITDNLKTISNISIHKSFLENFRFIFENQVRLQMEYSTMCIVDIGANITNIIKMFITVNNSTLEACEWKRIHFDGYLSDNYFKRCKFTDCDFSELYGDAVNIFIDCDFYDCIMPDNPNNTFITCSFNESTTFPKGTTNRESMIYPGGIAWKKVFTVDSNGNLVTDNDEMLVKLEIPKDAEVRGFGTGKYRVSKAKVLGFYDLDMKLIKDKTIAGSSVYNAEFMYKKGETVIPDSFSLSYKQCDHGIHCFPNPSLAIDYCL
jgi:hypothetical protein